MFKVNGRIWIEALNGSLIGSGRIVLLEKIKKTGSISVAAKEMKMSYSQAWSQIDALNKKAKNPLVIKASGGIGGGGSILTEEGEKVIKTYHQLNKTFSDFINQQNKEIKI